MTANELRIGNLVLCQKTNEPCHVALIHGYHPGTIGLTDIPHGYFFHDHITTIEGIPLTEEWLKKFGFKWNPDKKKTHLTIKGKVVEIHFYHNENREIQEMQFSHVNSDMDFVSYPNNIKHVHQLQNLFFALTGEELTMNKQDVADTNKVVG